MARLMKYQMDHAQNKLREIAMDALGNCPEDEEFDMPSSVDFAKAIIAGDIKITPKMLKYGMEEYVKAEESNTYNRKTPTAFIRHQYYAKEVAAQEKREAKLLKDWEKRRAVMAAAQEEAIDRIILGGEEVALQAIKDFAAAVKSM
jgi:hypothetical protein